MRAPASRPVSSDHAEVRARGHKLSALRQEVDQVERTMEMLRAELEKHQPGDGRDRPPPNGNGNGHDPGELTTGPLQPIAAAAGWPLRDFEAVAQSAPQPAASSHLVGVAALLATVVGALVFLVAGPHHAAFPVAKAHFAAFDVAVAALAVVDAYLIALALTGRQSRTDTVGPSRGQPFFLLVVPAFGSSGAIQQSVRRLLNLNYERYLVMVVGNEAGVTHPAPGWSEQNRHLIRADLPGASRADALNYAFATACELVDGRDPRLEGASSAGTILGVIEPGTWLHPRALHAVGRQLDRHHCAATQARVRIADARSSSVAAVEDLETAAFHVLGQTARDRSGTANLMSSGAFFRLAPLRKLTSEPWIGGDDDELDISLCLIEAGFQIKSCRGAVAYQPGASSFSGLSRRRRRRARARRKAWPHISKLWETRRVSVAARLSMTLQLLMAGSLLAPAVPFACLVAIGLGFVPTDHSWIVASLHGGIGARALVLMLLAAPVLALCLAYRGVSGESRPKAQRASGVRAVSTWLLPGIGVALLIHGLLRILPGGSDAVASERTQIAFGGPAVGSGGLSGWTPVPEGLTGYAQGAGRVQNGAGTR